ncbi:annexin A13-like isoform X1 [Mercenaria mercenaria]|uniref:annexin A13-like isoform X1 n=1 Tax=Mercenaria mercenaria TaxID=6596 RepID=UPI001E1E0604|nr:annexin A13-like isoform X1 [Mercenaria mercenaria]
MATIAGDFNFTDEEAKVCAEKLKDAMDGFGTNEADIVEVLVTHNNEQRQAIAETYRVAYGKPLIEDLISELTGDLEEVVCALMTKPREYDAKMLHDAICGAGTDEYTLIGILCTRTNEEIEQIKEAYTTLYEADLVEDIQGDTSGYFGRMLYSLAQAGRQDCDSDDDLADEEAQKLIDAGVGQLGTDECDFNSVLCLSSYRQLKKVFEKYQEKREGKSIEEDIDSEMGSDLKDGYLAIVKVTKDKEGYFAERLHKAMKGWGTDDSELIRLICSHAETDLLWIAERYKEMFEGADLFENVKDECGGYYKSVLLSLIAGRYVSKDE